jgi:predicted ribosomally synthesized peptide with SipW-like signal peptide
VTDRRSLSRRKLLWAAATVGAAASTGTGTAALMHDTEMVNGSVAAGVLDLDTDPTWGNDSGTGPFDGGTVSKDDSGEERITLSVSNNPSYLWFRTRCIQCDPAEEAIYVRFGIDTDGDGTVDEALSSYLSLRDARAEFGEWVSLGEVDPSDTWELVVEWEVRENVAENEEVDFDFRFYATQSRHVMNTDSVAPVRECPSGCITTSGGPSAISWVALCAPDTFSKDDVEFTRSDDGRTLTFRSLPETVDTVLIKYGTNLDVFDGRPESVTAGDGTTYTQDGTSFPGTDPERSNPTPCPGSYGCKYEFPDETGDGGWECKQSDPGTPGDGNGTGTGTGTGNGNGNGNGVGTTARSPPSNPSGGDR